MNAGMVDTLAGRLVTGEELLRMPDRGPCELLDGKIVSMVPPGGEHCLFESNLDIALKLFARQQKLGRVLVGEVGIYTRRNPDRVRAADIVFLSKERLPGKMPQGYLHVAPDLVVEILSPHDQWREVQEKVQEYLAIGVSSVWLVESRKRMVHVYHASNERAVQQLGIDDTLHGEGTLAGFALPVRDIFADDLDD